MSERQKHPPLIRDESKEGLIKQLFYRQTVSDESLYRAQRLITSDAARFLDMRLREANRSDLAAAQYELGWLSYVLSGAATGHENVLVGASSERTKAQEDGIIFLHGAIYALEHVIYARKDWMERENRRKHMELYAQRLKQLINELDSFTTTELWSLLHGSVVALAEATDDQELIQHFNREAYVGTLQIDHLLPFLTTEENGLYESKLLVDDLQLSSATDSAPIAHQT